MSRRRILKRATKSLAKIHLHISIKVGIGYMVSGWNRYQVERFATVKLSRGRRRRTRILCRVMAPQKSKVFRLKLIAAHLKKSILRRLLYLWRLQTIDLITINERVGDINYNLGQFQGAAMCKGKMREMRETLKFISN